MCLKEEKWVTKLFNTSRKLQIKFYNVVLQISAIADVLSIESDLFCVKLKYEDTQNNANLTN